MKITTVKYKKLFNLGNFQNEEIELTANVEEGENPIDCLIKLHLEADRAHKKIFGAPSLSRKGQKKIAEALA